jgi:hypothetical protein
LSRSWSSSISSAAASVAAVNFMQLIRRNSVSSRALFH